MRAPTRTTTVDMLSAEELQEEAARLLKHMSIGAVLCLLAFMPSLVLSGVPCAGAAVPGEAARCTGRDQAA